MIDQRLHFNCAFQLMPSTGELDYGAIISIFRQWLRRKLPTSIGSGGHLVDQGWLIEGVPEPIKFGSHSVQSASEVGTGLPQEPEYWSLRYEHPDSTLYHRTWRTDIGLTRTNDYVTFSLQLVHFLKPGYIGREDLPSPSTPVIVRELMEKGRSWRCQLNDISLVPKPCILKVGKGQVLRDLLSSRSRSIPIVFASMRDSGEFLLDTNRLAQQLTGLALVIRPESIELDHELSHLIEQPFRTFDGAVRVYQPNVRFDTAADARRHRYFNREMISRLGARDVEDEIIRGVLRQPVAILGNWIKNIVDVAERKRERRFNQEKSESRDSAEWIKALEERNTELEGKVRQNQELLETYDTLLRDREADLSGLEDQKKDVEHRLRTVEQENLRLRGANAAFQRSNSLWSEIQLPESPLDVVMIAQRAFADRLFVHSQALKAAKDAKGLDCNEMWTALQAMAVILHRLHFEERKNMQEIIRLFKAESGLELAVGESESTMNNRALARQFQIDYKGETRNIEAHVKNGRSPGKAIRIHYCLDQTEELLVIGHCGRHLTTSRTN
jgi:hypothetical protein